jgi:hypothetical protein
VTGCPETWAKRVGENLQPLGFSEFLFYDGGFIYFYFFFFLLFKNCSSSFVTV